MQTLLLTTATFCCCAATTVDPTNRYAYSGNLGWMDGRGETNNGAVIGEYVCSGYIYAANVGWISLGNSSPPGGIYYSNTGASDWGVNNQDGLGNLRGYAYGANIGWIAFENTGTPKVDLATGNFSGYVWSANCGWIGLTNTFAHVQTDTVLAGTDSDGDGIPDAWELTYTNTLTVFNATSDTDHDGVSDKNEYYADTNPLDPSDYLNITAITQQSPPGTYTTLSWPGKPTRFYAAQRRNTLDPSDSWGPDFVSGGPGAVWFGFNVTTNQQFFRIRAFRPLTP